MTKRVGTFKISKDLSAVALFNEADAREVMPLLAQRFRDTRFRFESSPSQLGDAVVVWVYARDSGDFMGWLAPCAA